MTIQDIYNQYHIMPNLQTHMYRVAAVAQQLCEVCTEPLNANEVITASLLHDMGNIIKFDLEKFPAFLAPQGLEFWQNVQNQYFEKYGHDEHQAALDIAQAIPVSMRIVELVDSVGFHQIQAVLEGDDFAKKICEYADARVTPFGVTSLEARLQDLKNRYSQKYPSPQDQQRRREFAELAHQLEAQVFNHSSIQPGDITDQTVNTRLENLQKFEIIRA